MNSMRQMIRHVAPRGVGRLSNNQQRSLFVPTIPLLEQKTIQVPTMGDSITEGTIVEWTVKVGQAVKEDDVIALVETDKVTVDIKAEIPGVIVQQFGAVDETVEVGANLYVIDTDAEATVAATDTAETTSDTPAPAAATTATTTTTTTSSPSTTTSVPTSNSNSRKPSIHFLGKDGWDRRRTQQQQPAISLIPDKPNGTVVLDGSMIDSRFGRPPFTEKEMEALITGGANLAPDVTKLSGGAAFSV